MPRKYSLIGILVLVLGSMSACAHKEAPNEATIRQQVSNFEDISKDKTLRVVPEHYVGVRRVPLKSSASPILQTRVTVRSHGSLQEVADIIMELVPVTVNLTSEHDAAKGASNTKGAPVPVSDPGVEELLRGAAGSSYDLPGDYPKNLNINYDGKLVGLLDQIAAQSGYGWDYNRASNTITLARTLVRTFLLTAAPGSVTYDNQMTNRSHDNRAGTGSLGDKVNSTVQTGGNDAQTTQTYSSNLKHDIWADTLKNVESMLSSIGKATGNQGAGTITVRDRPENLRQIAAFIDEINARYDKQVAMKVNAYVLELKDENSAGIDLQAIFENDQVRIVAGALNLTSGAVGTASATIVDAGSKLRDSQAVLKALKQYGNARSITSAGVVAMNNQPAPVLAIHKTAYLAGTSIDQTDYGKETTLTPGEVTTGFSMTLTPHIMTGRRLILQYNVNLSVLDSMEEFTSGDATVQLPQVSTRAFSQRASMMMGQTLVLAGFQQAIQSEDTSFGILSVGKNTDFNKSIIVITIQVENASPELAQEATI